MSPDNPFATRFIDPDQHPFVFPAHTTLDSLSAQMMENKWWGEIIGPHGTGKSTLLHTLLQWAEKQGLAYRFAFLNDQQNRLPADWTRKPLPDFYAIDGAEQLSRWAWLRVNWHCRRHQRGLLVTAHQSLGLPPAYRTNLADARTAQRVISVLTGGTTTLELDLARQLAARHSGNMREILFELYDRWEDERRQS